MDFETRSRVELKHVGTYRYARDPSTEPICLCYTWDDDPRVWVWHPGFEDLAYKQAPAKGKEYLEVCDNCCAGSERLVQSARGGPRCGACGEKWPFRYRAQTRADLPPTPFPEELACRIRSGEEVEAHNAFFEQNIWDAIMVERFGFPAIDHDQWRCSAAMAASFCMRRKLEHVASDLGLAEQKDMVGHKLMLKLCKPRQPTKRDPDSVYHQQRADLIGTMRYCVQDVRTERAVSNALRAIKGTELRIWKLDQKINRRGLHLDRPLVEAALEHGAHAEADAVTQLRAVTNGEVEKNTKREQFKAWLRSEGVKIPTKLVKVINDEGEEGMEPKESIGADLIRPLLKDSGCPDHVQRAIEIWIAVNKTSTKKYRAMLNRMSADDRVREVLRYWAATTGRWGGMGIQPQNLPRRCPKPDMMEVIVEDLKRLEYDELCMMYGRDQIMPLLASLLRGAITAAPGHDLLAADYSSVEARGTFWIAGHEDGLEQFRRLDAGELPGQDIYTLLASRIHGRLITKKDDEERQQGKAGILGCGYQMGAEKLITYAENLGVPLIFEQSRMVVDTYRSENWPVKDFWYEANDCALEAVRRGPKKPAVEMRGGKIKWKRLGAFLHCRLPNGRLLSYFKPRIGIDDRFGTPKMEFTGYATYKPGLWANCSTYGGKLTENIVQALCRDLMAEAMLRAEGRGYQIVLTVHDEIVAEMRKGEGDLAEFEAILSEVPEWAEGFPLVAEGWRRPRYGKA